MRSLDFRSTWLMTGAAVVIMLLRAVASSAQATVNDPIYEHEDTRALVALVNDAAAVLHTRGEAAFADFRVPDSRWRHGDVYIFVIDRQGNMLVHPDPAMEGKNELALKDIHGRPIIQGLIDAAMVPAKPEGWYHYQWPVPGGLLPRWKSSYVRLVDVPSGQRYVVGSGVYNDRMERAFVMDMVTDAVARIETHGAAAYSSFRDPTGPFMAKDAYVFVVMPDGIEAVNPAFPNLEGRNLLDLKDTEGKPLVRNMFDVVRATGSGWVDYMWPKPGDNASTRKSAYVARANLGTSWVLVGCGVYLADAPKAPRLTSTISAPELMALVREGASALEAHGEGAYPAFREKGSKWFRDDTYFFVWTQDGVRAFHAADPSGEGQNVSGLTDILGRPIGRMILNAAASRSGEGWIHYMYPEPGDIFPTWKSTFVKRVTFPSGQTFALGSGIYNMQMDDAFIQDVVDRAASLVAEKGKDAFAELRDKKGPFVFMDTYVFVDTPEGIELVNPAQPSMEGTNLMAARDLKGTALVSDYIALALKEGSGWLEYYWYKPGENTPAPKRTFVRKVQFGPDTYIVGSGYYIKDASSATNQ